MFNWINDLFKNEDFCTPVVLYHDKEFYTEFENRMNFMCETLERVNAPVDITVTANEMSNNLIKSMQNYYEGNIVEAQKIITYIVKKLMNNKYAKSNINNSATLKGIGSVLYNTFDVDNNKADIDFFRARVCDESKVFELYEMLHIPFDMREKIATQRFSLPGLPCLYLSTSSYGCWNEMNKPSDNMFFVSYIRLHDSFEIFNLGINDYIFRELANIANKEETSDEDKKTIDDAIKSLFPLWILSFATSFRVLQKNMSFRSDYIIPQLIMLAVKQQGLDGIAYYSKQNKYDDYAFPINVNIVLFAHYNKEKKLSKICESIELIYPVNFAEFKQLVSASKYSASNNCKLFYEYFTNDMYAKIAGNLHRYTNTDFYYFDKYLKDKAKKMVKINLKEINTV